MSINFKHTITVIVSNYNYGKFVRDCLDSLTRQTRIPDGLIVVDDGSTDESRSVIEGFLATRGHLFRDRAFFPNQHNAGKLACVNQAVRLLDTPYALILDSDDFLADNAIETMLEHLLAARAENPYVGFVYPDSYLVNEDNLEIGRGKSTSWCRRLLRTRSYIPDCALTVSAALKRAAPFDETIRVGSKHHKWNRIADEGWIGHHIAEPLFYYRMHENNVSGIGKSILGEDKHDARRDRLMSGYWPTAVKGATHGADSRPDGEPASTP